MSLSKVISNFEMAEETVPIGPREVVERIEQQRRDSSPEEIRFRQLEEKYNRENEEAYQRGVAEGEARGLRTGQAEAVQVKNNLGAVINEINNYKNTLYLQSRQTLLDLAFALADKIVGARVDSEQGMVLESINKCINEILDKTNLRLKINPQQLQFVKQQIESIKQDNESISLIMVEEDNRVTPGGCIIETDSGSADARIESQLQMLRRELTKLER